MFLSVVVSIITLSVVGGGRVVGGVDANEEEK